MIIMIRYMIKFEINTRMYIHASREVTKLYIQHMFVVMYLVNY